MARTRAQLRAEQARLQAQRAQQPKVPASITPTTRASATQPIVNYGPTSETIPTGTIKQFPRFTPQQQGLQQQFLQQLMPMLQQLSKPIDVNPIIEQRTRDFKTQTIPSLMERLGTGLTGQGERSSALGGALGAAGSGLQQDLASLQTQAQMSDMGRLQKLFGGLSGLGFEQQYDRGFFPDKPGFGEVFSNNLASGLGSGISGGIGSLLKALLGLAF